MKEINLLSDLLNRTLYGHMNIFNGNVKQYPADDW